MDRKVAIVVSQQDFSALASPHLIKCRCNSFVLILFSAVNCLEFYHHLLALRLVHRIIKCCCRCFRPMLLVKIIPVGLFLRLR
ncbi:Uncharacterised protein [Enterobacter hormaechei]|nr:Uncharacterised protein [Enterobacter hormaechei]